MGDMNNMQANSKYMILVFSSVIFCLIGPLTFWLGEQSSQASWSCPPHRQQADGSPVVFVPGKNP